jgi:hypothetical protein
MAENNVVNWRLDHLASRDELERVEKELTELRAFKAACEGQGAVATIQTCGSRHSVSWSDRGIAGFDGGTLLYPHPDPEAAQLRVQVAKLTEQRDMAAEALRSVVFGSGDWFNLMPATLHDSLCDYLAAIKSSEVKQ